MEPWQAIYLENKYGKNNACSLLGLWGANPQPYIHDPFASNAAYFDKCFAGIESSVDEITGKIKQTAEIPITDYYALKLRSIWKGLSSRRVLRFGGYVYILFLNM